MIYLKQAMKITDVFAEALHVFPPHLIIILYILLLLL